ncbi:MAG: DUF6285 domain-containing protein [Janthinobacterium lividum]
MSNFVPPAATLLQAASQYLEGELMPTLQGYQRFQTRVIVNVLRIVERELRLSDAQISAEGARVAALLDAKSIDWAASADLTAEADQPSASSANDALNASLCDAIRDGRFALDDPQLLTHLRETLRGALSINNPKWLPANAGR